MMESIFGVHESALLFRARRMGVLATNLANADTPHFKARDMDFATALEAAESGGIRMRTTHERHIGAGSDPASASLQYRVPYQPSEDGNTVEADMELSRYAENAVAYQASLMFLNGKIATLRAAITGGR